jgi:hypothetical protein
LRTPRPQSSDASPAQKRIDRFVEKYVDSTAKAELLRILAYRPSQFQTLPEILALTRSSSPDIERAVFALRGLGLIQLKEGPRGAAIALSPNSRVRRMAPALWRHLKKVIDAGPE